MTIAPLTRPSRSDQPQVEPAAPGDAKRIAELLDACAPHTIPLDEAQISKALERYRVIRDAGRVQATAALQPADGGGLELCSVAVDPESGGRGLGTSIVRAMQDEARDRDRRLLCVTTSPEFFARVGFRQTPTLVPPPKPERTRCPCVGTRVAMVWDPADDSAREGAADELRKLARSA